MNKINFYNYLDEKSVLVITPIGSLKRLYCPFNVVYFKSKDNFSQELLVVEGIAKGTNSKIYYRINNRYYSHSNYMIVSK